MISILEKALVECARAIFNDLPPNVTNNKTTLKKLEKNMFIYYIYKVKWKVIKNNLFNKTFIITSMKYMLVNKY